MLIPRSQKRRPGEAGRGHGGVRRCASLGWEPPDAHPSRNAGVSCCPPPSHPLPSLPPCPGRRRTHSDGPGPAAASVQLMLKWEATDGQRILCFQRSGGDPVSGETQSRDSRLESLGVPGLPNPGLSCHPWRAPTPCRGVVF